MDEREINLMMTQEEALHIAKRVGAEEPKSHDGGQIDRHSTRCPKIKWACAKRLQEEALYITKGRSQRTEVA